MKQISRIVLKKERNSFIAFTVLAVVIVTLFVFKFDQTFFSNAFHSICIATREYVGFSTIFCLLFLLFFVFTKYGNIRIGGPDAKPDFSTISWISCLTMAGLGIGIVFYSQEPLFHLNNNPYIGRAFGSPEAIAYSLTLYDWTLNCWGMYGVLGIIIAYFHYNKGRELKLSAAFPPRTPNWIKILVDIVMALGIVAGLTTSLGLGVAQLKGGIEYVFNVDFSPYLLMSIIGLVAVWSVNSGLRKGVKWLSNLTTFMILTLLAIVVVLATKQFDLAQGFIEYTGKGVGNFIVNFVEYNKFWDAASDDWAASWAVFYQLWFAAWAAFVAVFLAKISKGRTFRETILAVVLLPTLLTALWYGVFGNAGLAIKEPLYAMMQESLPQALFFFLNKLTGGTGYAVLSLGVMIAICCIFVTSSDSSSYVVATLLSPDKEVRNANKIAWGIIQCISAIALYFCGGLSLVQSASVVLGLAVVAIILIGSIYFIYVIVRENRNSRKS